MFDAKPISTLLSTSINLAAIDDTLSSDAYSYYQGLLLLEYMHTTSILHIQDAKHVPQKISRAFWTLVFIYATIIITFNCVHFMIPIEELQFRLVNKSLIYSNNTGATYHCVNTFHSHIKHLSIDYHFLAFLLTKPLGFSRHKWLTSKVGFNSSTTILWGNIN
ncbi:hypothetical protein CR513_39027, partial [Mucuna pruriens]